MKIAVCICTFRRPQGLSRLLEQLAAINWENDLVVAVADNDQALHEGLDTVAALPDDYRWKVVSSAVEHRGISFSRNTATRLALAESPDLIAFIDDDEWPSPNWLEELYRVQRDTGADAVGGPTLPVFPDSATETQKRDPYFGADLNLPDGSACQLEAAGNFLVKASVLRDMQPEVFNPAFALSGGEDLAFFTQMKQAGLAMHWAAEARVFESVPEERLSPDWMRRRVMLIANSRVHVMSLLEPGILPAAVRCLKTAALFVQATLVTASALASRSQVAKAQALRWKFWGKLTAHLSIKPQRLEGR